MVMEAYDSTLPIGRNWMGTLFWTAVATVTGTAGMLGGGAERELQPSDSRQAPHTAQIAKGQE